MKKRVPFGFLIASILVLVVGSENAQIQSKLAASKVLGAQSHLVSSDYCSTKEDCLLYWQEVSKQHPDYLDAYLQLTVLYWENGSELDAKKALKKATMIDPNNSIVALMNKLL